MSYDDYLNSEHWKKTAREVRRRHSSGKKARCLRCKLWFYKRIDCDLELLCEECHAKEHEKPNLVGGLFRRAPAPDLIVTDGEMNDLRNKALDIIEE